MMSSGKAIAVLMLLPLLHPHVIIFRYISVTGLTASANLAFIQL